MSMVAGVVENDILETVRLLSDPTRLKASLDQLQVAKDQAQAVIELAGPASEILTLRAAIEEDRQQAQDLLTQAQGRVAQIVKNAEASAVQIEVAAREEAAKRKAAVDAELYAATRLKEDAQTLNAQAMGEQAELQARLIAVGEQIKALDAAQIAVNEKQAELDQRIGQLENVRAAVQSVLST